MVVAQMGITHGHFDVFVSHEIFNGHDVCATHYQARRVGMAEIMPVEIVDPRGLHAFFKPAGAVSRRHSFTVIGYAYRIGP
jgi:hypothetical protein